MIALKIPEIASKHEQFSSQYIHHLLSLSPPVDHPLRVSGRMENDTGWGLKREVDGSIVANGRKASRGAMG